MTVDKLEQMLGSYAPSPDGTPYTKNFTEDESPSGMLARSGTYTVRSRVVDDDGEIYIGESVTPQNPKYHNGSLGDIGGALHRIAVQVAL